MPELRKKNALYRILIAERNVKRKAASLQSLQTYLRYKSQKRSVDHFMF
jgi:ribosomal protein S16